MATTYNRRESDTIPVVPSRRVSRDVSGASNRRQSRSVSTSEWPPTPKLKPRRVSTPVLVIPPARRNWYENIARALAFLTIAALSSPVSQTTLAPVFGAIPSSVNHKEVFIATPILAFGLRYFFRNIGKEDVVAKCLAVWAFWIPFVSMCLFRSSDEFGPQLGPVIIGFLSCHTIIIPAVYSAAEAIEDLGLVRKLNRTVASFLTAIIGTFTLVSIERAFAEALPELAMKRAFEEALPEWKMTHNMFTPVKLQILMASALAILAPSKLLLLALPGLIHTLTANPHFDSHASLALANTTLNQHGWAIRDRQWSNTGYISVLEHLKRGEEYRVLRCDHSLLGGEHLLTDARREENDWTTTESIYSVFEMLEAVRLIKPNRWEPQIKDSNAKALVVGLGIGTLPKAFIQHGIDTTILELDPVVHEFATKYFGLPTNHTPIITDALPWAKEAYLDGLRYDYIIHDVFTGGAEPLALFTEDFIDRLKSLLTKRGFLAINYAGNLNHPLTKKVLETIDTVFDTNCIFYRETSEAEAARAGLSGANKGFTNIIIFCRRSPGPFVFRNATERDFLGSVSREYYLVPNPEKRLPPPEGREMEKEARFALNLKDGMEGEYVAHQVESARQHWYVMRKVVPGAVWGVW